jgi:hypothetical protein
MSEPLQVINRPTPFTIDRLFPVCLVPTCPQKGKRHALPWQRDLFAYKEQYIYCQGGVGSAKTIAFACLMVLDLLLVPKNRGIIFRKDFNLNYKTAWMRFNECLDGLVEQGFIPKVNRSVKKFGEYTRVELHNGSICEAAQSKNWSEYLGPEYGSVWVDDAMESTAEMWIGVGTSGGLESRIRHSQAAYATFGRFVVNRLRGYISTNPPPGVSDWWTVFGREPGVRQYEGTDVSYRHIQVSSKDNDHLPPNYLETLTAHHSVEDIARIIEGKSVVYYGGRGVYKDHFRLDRHVGEFSYSVALPLFVSIDYGYHHPAIIYAQIRVCPFKNEHYIVLGELTKLRGITAYTLYAAHQQLMQQHYKNHQASLVFYACDIAGFKQSDSNEDRRGPARIWRDEFGLQLEARRFELSYSLDYMRKLFDVKNQCPCGMSQLLIDRKAEMLIEAYEGGYRYAHRKDGSLLPDPVKDHTYDDPADAHRYGVEHFLRLGHNYGQWREQANRLRAYSLSQPEGLTPPWEWMESSTQAVGNQRFAY